MSWLGGRPRASDLLATRPSIASLVGSLRSDAQLECPGRTAELITVRLHQIVDGSGSLQSFGELSAAERAVVAVAEQFVLDVHGIDDSLIGELGVHFSAAEQVAIMFHLALADGFVKFNRVFAVEEPS